MHIILTLNCDVTVGLLGSLLLDVSQHGVFLPINGFQVGVQVTVVCIPDSRQEVFFLKKNVSSFNKKCFDIIRKC